MMGSRRADSRSANARVHQFDRPLLGARMAAAPDGKLRWVLAAASIVKCQWGIGMMAMPFMLQQAGLLTGVVQFSISMLITCDAVFRLIAVKAWVLQGRQKGGGGGGSVNDALLGEPAAGHLAESRSKRMLTTREVDQAIAGGIAGGILTLDYNGIIKAVLGPAWEFVSLVAIVVSCYGSNIAYVIFISGNLTQFLGPAVPLVAWQWALLSMVPFLALATGKDVVFLAPFGVLGLCCALSFWGVMLYDAFSTISWVHFTAWAAAAPQLEVKTLPIAVSIAAFCNEGVVIMALNVQDSMREPSRFSSAMVSALVFFAVCYLMLGVAGLSLYHANTNCDKPGVAHQVCSPISRAMCAIDSNTTATQKFCEAGTSRVRTAAVVLYAMQLVPTYAIVYWCSYESWENYYLRWASIPRGACCCRRRCRRQRPLLLHGVAMVSLPAAACVLTLANRRRQARLDEVVAVRAGALGGHFVYGRLRAVHPELRRLPRSDRRLRQLAGHLHPAARVLAQNLRRQFGSQLAVHVALLRERGDARVRGVPGDLRHVAEPGGWGSIKMHGFRSCDTHRVPRRPSSLLGAGRFWFKAGRHWSVVSVVSAIGAW